MTIPSHVTYNAYHNSYANTILNCHQSVVEGKIDLPSWLLDMQGMSGKKYRRMINNIVKRVPNARYLEVGSWAGSTVCAATYENNVTALCIDNWSEFNPQGDIRHKFESNTARVCSNQTRINVIEQDFNTVDYSSIGLYNVYLFDGPHAKIDQYKGVVIAQPALEDEYILIVDDWNRSEVREGTLEALFSLSCEVPFSMEIRTTLDNTDPPFEHCYETSDWHNGYLFAVVKKK